MAQLSDELVDIVYRRLRKYALRNGRLEAELLDHYCCYIEEAMGNGADFEDAYKNAVANIAPNGAKEIEFELYYLINFNKQLSMKKLIFLIGFLSVFMVSSGIMFKSMNWFGANVLMVSGFVLSIITMVVLSIHLLSFLRNQSGTFWFRSMTGILSVILIASGSLFRFFHLPSANIQYTLGMLLLNFVFLPLFFYHLYKRGVMKTSM